MTSDPIEERDATIAELRAEVGRMQLLLADETYREEGGRILVGQLQEARRRAEAAEAEVRDLRAKVAAVEALAEQWSAAGAGDVAWHWDMLAEAVRQAVASAGRTEPAPEGDNSSRSLPNPNRKDQDQS